MLTSGGRILVPEFRSLLHGGMRQTLSPITYHHWGTLVKENKNALAGPPLMQITNNIYHTCRMSTLVTKCWWGAWSRKDISASLSSLDGLETDWLASTVDSSVRSGPALPLVQVFQAGQWFAVDVFCTSDHHVKVLVGVGISGWCSAMQVNQNQLEPHPHLKLTILVLG